MKKKKVNIIFINNYQETKKFTFNDDILIEKALKKYCKESDVELDSLFFLVGGNTIQKEDFKRPISSLKKHYIDTRSSNDNSFSLSSKIDIESPNTLKILVYKNSFYEPIQSNQSNFFQKYYKIFIIIGVIIVILCICIIMLFTIIFKTKDDKKINPQINVLQDTDKVIITNKSNIEDENIIKISDIEENIIPKISDIEENIIPKTSNIEEKIIPKTSNIEEKIIPKTSNINEIIKYICKDRCHLCNNYQCLECIQGYDLFKGDCISYAFKGVYTSDNDKEKIKLFNSDKTNNLLAMKIDNNILSPISEYNIPINETINVYYYIKENYSISLSNIFENITRLVNFSFNDLNIDFYNITEMKRMFSGCSSLYYVDFYPFIGQNINDISGLFLQCQHLSSINFSTFKPNSLKYMNLTFYGCVSLSSLDLSNFNTQNVIYMDSMFNRCYQLTSLNLSNFNTQNVISMSSMFSICESLVALDLSNFNTQNVTSMDRMFYACSSLSSIDLSSFNTEIVIYMDWMLDLYSFNTEIVIYMDLMFAECEGLTSLDLSNFNTQNVIYMNSMFFICSSLSSLDLSNSNTQKVISIVLVDH